MDNLLKTNEKIDLNNTKWLPEIKKSSIKIDENGIDPGKGVFINGVVYPGTLLGFYPGFVFTPYHWAHDEGYKYLKSHPSTYKTSWYDGTIFDAFEYKPKIMHPYVIGHMINHPPINVKPNAELYLYNVPLPGKDNPNFPQRLQKYIPNNYPFDLSLKDRLMNQVIPHYIKTMAVVAIDKFENSEIFIDYQYLYFI